MTSEEYRIAIIISNSEYDNLGQLDFCRNDGDAMLKILNATNKYNEIFYNHGSSTSAEARAIIRSAVEKYENNKITELFFYFSDHGVISNDFIFCCKDFKSRRPKSTSIPNEELDTLFRSLSPDVVVKVIDACQSGKRMIKDVDVFEKAIASKGFNNFIQMASCLDNQLSYGNQKFSFFTEKFLQSTTNQKENPIYYFDIMNYISDSFEDDIAQTPLFTLQITGREVFCEDAAETYSIRDSLFGDEGNSSVVQEGKATISIGDIIKEREKEYISKKEVENILIEFKNSLGSIELNEDIIDYFEVLLHEHQDFEDVPSISSIASGIDNNKDPDMLCEIRYEDRTRDIPYRRSNVFGLSFPGLFGQSNLTGEENKTRMVNFRVPIGIRPKDAWPFAWLQLQLEPKAQCLPPLAMAVLFVPYRTKCRIYSSFISYKRASWDEFRMDSASADWSFKEHQWLNFDVSELSKGFLNQFSEKIEQVVEEIIDVDIGTEKDNSND